jgi:hypothetical protein
MLSDTGHHERRTPTMMMHKRPPDGSAPTPVNRRWMRLFAVTAVLAALGAGTVGGAHAGSLITGRQIKDNSVLSRDVRNGTLTGRDVHDGRLTARDFEGDTTGPIGNAGPIGPTGLSGVHDVTIQESGLVQIDPQQQVLIIVDCPQGFAVSGGLSSGSVSDILESSPDNANRSWSTWAFNPSTVHSINVTADASCAQVNVGP